MKLRYFAMCSFCRRCTRQFQHCKVCPKFRETSVIDDAMRRREDLQERGVDGCRQASTGGTRWSADDRLRRQSWGRRLTVRKDRDRRQRVGWSQLSRRTTWHRGRKLPDKRSEAGNWSGTWTYRRARTDTGDEQRLLHRSGHVRDERYVSSQSFLLWCVQERPPYSGK